MIFSKRNDIHIISYINIRNNYSFFVFSSIYFFLSMKFKFSSSQKKGILHFSSPTIYHKVLKEKFKTVCHESKKTHFSRDMNMSLHGLLNPSSIPVSFDYHRHVDHPPSLSPSRKMIVFSRERGELSRD